MSFRTVTGLKGERTTLLPEDFEADDDGVIDPQGETESLDVEAAKGTVMGAVIAIGFEVPDDFGFKFNLETRYTRWFDKPIDVGFARSNASQLEIVVGLSF